METQNFTSTYVRSYNLSSDNAPFTEKTNIIWLNDRYFCILHIGGPNLVVDRRDLTSFGVNGTNDFESHPVVVTRKIAFSRFALSRIRDFRVMGLTAEPLEEQPSEVAITKRVHSLTSCARWRSEVDEITRLFPMISFPYKESSNIPSAPENWVVEIDGKYVDSYVSTIKPTVKAVNGGYIVLVRNIRNGYEMFSIRQSQ